MAIIKSVRGISPVFGEDCFIADNATIVGEVIMGNRCSIWFNSVVRGDVNSITIGDYTNIQDGAVIHCTYKKAKTTIGNQVSIGHNAIVHGCNVEDNALVGMGAIVMDHAHIGAYAIIAAGSVVLEGTKVEPATIYAGVPAKKVKDVDETMKLSMYTTAQNYLKYSEWFKG